jgi:hypothetical protein
MPGLTLAVAHDTSDGSGEFICCCGHEGSVAGRSIGDKGAAGGRADNR